MATDRQVDAQPDPDPAATALARMATTGIYRLPGVARDLQRAARVRAVSEGTTTWHEGPAGRRRRGPHDGIDRPREQTVAKFIQICASRDDLFALDEEGNIYQYNFNTKTWVQLVGDRSH